MYPGEVFHDLDEIIYRRVAHHPAAVVNLEQISKV